MRVKHKFQSTKADPADASLVGASKWNDEHDFEFPVGTMGDGITFAAGTLTLDLSKAEYFDYTLTANVTTLAFTGAPAAGRGRSFMLLLKQDATARTFAFPATFRWEGAVPTISTGSGAVDLLSGTMIDGAKWDVTLSKGRV